MRLPTYPMMSEAATQSPFLAGWDDLEELSHEHYAPGAVREQVLAIREYIVGVSHSSGSGHGCSHVP
jgi:hypothetical protein